MPDTSQPSATGHTIDGRPSARWAKFQWPVLSDDLFDAGLVSVRAGLVDDGAVGFGTAEGLAHGGGGNFGRVKLFRITRGCLLACVLLQRPKCERAWEAFHANAIVPLPF